MNSTLIDAVSALLAQAASEIVLPRFRRLEAADIIEKSPGELVTVADRAVEAMLIPRLMALRPGSRVVGEEGVAENPDLLLGLDQGEVWVVDPIDGTSNFVAGRCDFGIMVALMRDGETRMAWILFPVDGSLAVAELGSGAWFKGQRLRLDARDPLRSRALHGVVKTGFMPTSLRLPVDALAKQHIDRCEPGTMSACGDYRDYASGSPDFGLYWRTLPWDHAPGTLLLTEAGGHVARFDGTPYRPADERKGLLVARSRAVWEQTQELLSSALLTQP